MRIVFATGIYPPDIGGPATYVSGLAPELLERGWNVEVVTYGERAQEDTPFPIRRVSRSSLLPLRYLSFLATVRRVSRPADLIYAQDPLSSGLPAFLAARSLGCPAVIKIVGDLAWEIASEQGLTQDSIEVFQTRRYSTLVESIRRLQRFVTRGVNRVLVPSQYLKRIVCGWGVPAERIDVVPNSLPATSSPAPSREKARRQLGLGSQIMLLSAGRLVPWKGFDTLIRLMPNLLTGHPSTRLFIAGSGPCEMSLKNLVADLGLGEAITFTGPLDSETMAMHLRASDLLVLASTYEGFSHLLLEAMQAGVPVIATDIGGNPELVENGRSGVLVPPDQPEPFIKALRELCGDRGVRARLAQAGLERAKAFQWESMVEDTVRVLQSFVHPRSSSRASSNRPA